MNAFRVLVRDGSATAMRVRLPRETRNISEAESIRDPLLIEKMAGNEHTIVLKSMD